MNHIKSRSDVEAISLYEASKQALEALEFFEKAGLSTLPSIDATVALRTAIEAAESRSDVEKQSAEPVAWADPQDIARKGYDLWVANEQVDSYTMPLYTTSPAAPVQEPMNWREHVEQRIRTWRQRTMNKCGDMLAIDDFMGQDSIDDLVDFVCDEWAGPPAAQPAVPLTDEQINLFINGRGGEDDEDYVEPTGDGFGLTDEDLVKLVRRVEAAHGITEKGGAA